MSSSLHVEGIHGVVPSPRAEAPLAVAPISGAPAASNWWIWSTLALCSLVWVIGLLALVLALS